MSKVLQIDDFEKGFFTIPLSGCDEDKLQEVIDCVEEEYLPKLFGVELSVLFIADLDAQGVPQTQRFTDVFEPFTIQPNDCIVQSKGLKMLLKGFVYFLYVRDSSTFLTTEGAVTSLSENSTTPNSQKHDIYSRWNNSVDYWEAIQYRMCTENPDDYPEFKGLEENYAIRY